MLARRSTDARSTNGEDIRNEKVTPIGSPALVKYRKDGRVVYYSLDDDHVKNILDQGLVHISHDHHKEEAK
jgi:hypothetical protein